MGGIGAAVDDGDGVTEAVGAGVVGADDVPDGVGVTVVLLDDDCAELVGVVAPCPLVVGEVVGDVSVVVSVVVGVTLVGKFRWTSVRGTQV